MTTMTPAKAASKARTSAPGEPEFGVAFKSVHPDVTAVWEEYEEDRRKWIRRSRDLRRKELGGREIVSDFHPRGHHVMGYAPRSEKDILPGWRILKRNEFRTEDGALSHYAEPIPETVRGGKSEDARHARDVLHRLQPPSIIYRRFGERFGMPLTVMGGTRDGNMALHYPAMQKLANGTVLLYWDCTTDNLKWDGKTIDGTIEHFRPIKVSEYYRLAGR